MPRKFAIFAVLLVVTLLLLFALADRIVGRVSFELQTGKTQFFPGEPLPLAFSWQNRSILPVKILHWEVGSSDPLGWYIGRVATKDIFLSVFFDGREELRYAGIIGDTSASMEDWDELLEPRGEIERVVDLGEIYDLRRPGKYKVIASYRPFIDRRSDDWLMRFSLRRTGTLVSELTIEVIPWTESEIEGVKERALAGDSGAVRLLGEYVGSSAIPLLRELVTSDNERVRLEAARALGLISDSRSD